MKTVSVFLFLLYFISATAQTVSIDYLSYNNIDAAIRESKQFALAHQIREITAYSHSENNKNDSSIYLIEKYDMNGCILYKKLFEYKNQKNYKEYFYDYDTIGRLIAIKEQNTFELPSFAMVYLKYDTENRVAEFQRKYDTFNYTYFDNGMIKTLNNGEYFYDADWKLLYIYDRKDTTYSIKYDSLSCQISTLMNDFIKIYTTQVNNQDCRPIEQLDYFFKDNKKNEKPYFKNTYLYKDGHIIERKEWIDAGVFKHKLKIKYHTKFYYNKAGLLMSEIEFKRFGKIPRVKRYLYR